MKQTQYVLMSVGYTINQEIFMYENTNVLNVCVNKFSWVPHKNTFNTKSWELLYMYCCTFYLVPHGQINAVRFLLQ